MRRNTLLSLLAWALVASASAYGSGGGGHRSHSHYNADPASFSCDDRGSIHIDDLQGEARGEEVRTLANKPLRVEAAKNGGIHLMPASGNDIQIKVCKMAAAPSDGEARRLLEGIALKIEGNTVRIEGPASSGRREGGWTASLLIQVPKGATIDLDARNGGISIYKTDATITAETVNGGISLHGASGKITVEAKNGGVSVKDCKGDIQVRVQNGGMNIDLGQDWQGTGLRASTHNGGMTVRVPTGFRSSLEVAKLGYGPIRCKGSVCGAGQKTWDDDDRRRYFRLGSGAPVVQVSTVNGGVVITDQPDQDDDED